MLKRRCVLAAAGVVVNADAVAGVVVNADAVAWLLLEELGRRRVLLLLWV